MKYWWWGWWWWWYDTTLLFYCRWKLLWSSINSWTILRSSEDRPWDKCDDMNAVKTVQNWLIIWWWLWLVFTPYFPYLWFRQDFWCAEALHWYRQIYQQPSENNWLSCILKRLALLVIKAITIIVSKLARWSLSFEVQLVAMEFPVWHVYRFFIFVQIAKCY